MGRKRFTELTRACKVNKKKTEHDCAEVLTKLKVDDGILKKKSIFKKDLMKRKHAGPK